MANCVHVCVCAHMYVSMFGVCSVLACRGQRFCIIRATDTDTSRTSVCVIECGVCVGVCMCVCMCVCLCVCVCTCRENSAASHWPHAKNALGREGPPAHTRVFYCSGPANWVCYSKARARGIGVGNSLRVPEVFGCYISLRSARSACRLAAPGRPDLRCQGQNSG